MMAKSYGIGWFLLFDESIDDGDKSDQGESDSAGRQRGWVGLCCTVSVLCRPQGFFSSRRGRNLAMSDASL